MNVASADKWLLLIECRREVAIAGLPLAAPQACEAIPAVARLLAHARLAGWPVFHVWRARHTRQDCRGPIPGLEPLSTEPVFRCSGLSALGIRAFRDAIEQACPRELLVAGFALGDIGLATLIGAHEAGVDVTLVEDAVAATPIGDRSAGDIERVIVALASRFARVATADECVAGERGGKIHRLGENDNAARWR